MVLIELKSPFVSVIGTILATLSEIALISSLLTLNGFYACKRLQAGRSISIRSHLRRISIINVLSLFIFFSVEVVFAFFNDPSSFYRSEVHSCISVTNSAQERGNSLQPTRANDIFVECRDIGEGTITQFAGNFSIETQQVQCSDNAMYSYKYSENQGKTAGELNLTRLDAELGCVPDGGRNGCVFVKQVANTSYCSEPFYLDQIKSLPEKMLFLTTELHFKPPSDLKIFARRALRTFLENIGSKAVLRRAIYSGAQQTNCPFDIRKGEATIVPLAVIVVLAFVWGTPIVIFLSSFLLRKRMFFDVSNPMDWGRQIVGTDEVAPSENLLLKKDEEQRTIVVISASAEETVVCNI